MNSSRSNKKFLNSREEILEVLKSELPEIELVKTDFIFSGWTSIIVDINDEYIAKFPRNYEKYEWLVNESKLIEVLKRHISLELPERKLYDGDTPFFLHKKLKGLLLPEDALNNCTPIQKQEFLKSVATFFSNLHSIPVSEFSGLMPTIQDVPNKEEVLKILSQDFSSTDLEKESLLFDQVNEIGLNPKELVPGYFDFHGGNIVVDPTTYNLLGVFDFDEMAIRNYHFEFREVLLRYDEKYVLELIKYYEEVSDHKVDVNKIWLYHIVWYMWEYSKMIANPERIAGIEGLDVNFHKNSIKSILDNKFNNK